MVSTTKVETTFSIELEVEVRGRYLPAVREQGPSYSSGGEPAEPPSIEDGEIMDLKYEVMAVTGFIGDGSIRTSTTGHSLFAGVDRANVEVRRLVDNLLKLVAGDVERELLGVVLEGPDPDDARDRMLEGGR